ncbi:dTDP-4-amino-4,6-dideoxygalactose transaminase [soil metagenome]
MDMPRSIPFNRPSLAGKELEYIGEALTSGHVASNGPFTRRAESALEAYLGAPRVFLTHSCTAALEICALLTVERGDEVIVPSFTYAATATAFVRCGATPVFVDICPDTLNIDPRAVSAAITPKTKAIVAVHYAGVGCDIDALQNIADTANLVFIEDAAHALGARYRSRSLGTFGAVSALSFNATKNVISGEGGALIVNDRRLIDRAQRIRDRGTNREQFLRKEVGEYSWVDLGSAFAPSDITAAYMLAQIEQIDAITAERLLLWRRYHAALAVLEEKGIARRPVVPAEAAHNAHIYYLLLADAARRTELFDELSRGGIAAVSHYVPLHSAPAGRKFGRTAGSLAVTDDVAKRMVRLPLYRSLGKHEQSEVIDGVLRSLIS